MIDLPMLKKNISPRPLVNVIISKSFLIIESKNSHSWDWNIYSETLASSNFHSNLVTEYTKVLMILT
jgi:hypothetical protein